VNDLNDYERCIAYWDDVFAKEADGIPLSASTGSDSLDDALGWLTSGAKSVLDFGCGNGSMLFRCALLGTRDHIGIDLSKNAVAAARHIADTIQHGAFSFYNGGVERLSGIAGASTDCIVLSNILDNLYPDDAATLLQECFRILRPGGRVLIKLNPFLTEERIKDWNIRVIRENLLDDGLLLWNNTTQRWRALIGAYFTIEKEDTVYYPEHAQTNRLFLATK
jgi:SAM-dependent methyltransferase